MNLDFLILAAADAGGAEPTPIERIITTFKIDWPLFIAQLITFLIVAFLLKKFAYGPVLEILEKRKARIADGEANLAEVKQRLADSEKETQAMIDKANADAKRMIEEARESASILGEKEAAKATAAAQATLAKAEEAAKAERVKMADDLKKEFGRLVVATTAQVSGKVLNDDDQRRINDEALTSVQN